MSSREDRADAGIRALLAYRTTGTHGAHRDLWLIHEDIICTLYALSGRTYQCQGCGSTESIAEIVAKHPKAIACCPEREMVATRLPAPINKKEE